MDNSFDKWLSSVKVVWETGKPEDIAPLCADEITWIERPFEKPLSSKAEIVEEWNGIFEQENISFSYEIVSFADGVGRGPLECRIRAQNHPRTSCIRWHIHRQSRREWEMHKISTMV